MKILRIAATAALLAAATSAHGEPVTFRITTACTVGRTCLIKLTLGDGPDDEVVTVFQANRVGPDMRYFPGDEYGSARVGTPGLMYLEKPVVLDETGTMRAPRPGDPPEAVLTFTQSVGVDEHGHVTFFYGFIHGQDVPLVRRSYLWGYAPTTVSMIGSIGGPRSPVVPRESPPEQHLRGQTSIRFRLDCDERNRCRLVVLMANGGEVGSAATHFRANRLGEDLRYFPREREGSTGIAGGAAMYVTDLSVVLEADGGMRSPLEGEADADISRMTSTIALDEAGHMTFFYGFVRDPDSSLVERFLIWGYPPETRMIDSPDEEPDAQSDAARLREREDI